MNDETTHSTATGQLDASANVAVTLLLVLPCPDDWRAAIDNSVRLAKLVLQRQKAASDGFGQ